MVEVVEDREPSRQSDSADSPVKRQDRSLLICDSRQFWPPLFSRVPSTAISAHGSQMVAFSADSMWRGLGSVGLPDQPALRRHFPSAASSW